MAGDRQAATGLEAEFEEQNARYSADSSSISGSYRSASSVPPLSRSNWNGSVGSVEEQVLTSGTTAFPATASANQLTGSFESQAEVSFADLESGTSIFEGPASIPLSHQHPGRRTVKETATEGILHDAAPECLARPKKHLLRQFTSDSIPSISSWIYSAPKLDLRQCLLNKTRPPVLLSDFRNYLEVVEYGSENLEFYLAVEHLASITDEAVLTVAITQTIDGFIRANSSCEINIDHVTRMRIIDRLKNDPRDISELKVAQAHCYELMRNGSFPRFLYKATYNNIGQRELVDRRTMFLVGLLLCIIWIPLALTQPWYQRRFRFCLFLPILLMLAGIVQVVQKFCPLYGVFGYRALRSISCSTDAESQPVGCQRRLFGMFRREKKAIEKVQEPCVRKMQIRKAAIIWVFGLLPISIALTFIIWVIPTRNSDPVQLSQLW